MITSPVMIISPSFLKKNSRAWLLFDSMGREHVLFCFLFKIAFSPSTFPPFHVHHGESISTHPSAQPRFFFSLGSTRYVTKASFDPSGRTSYSSLGTRQCREGKIDSEVKHRASISFSDDTVESSCFRRYLPYYADARFQHQKCSIEWIQTECLGYW